MHFISGPTGTTDKETYKLIGEWGSRGMLWSNGEREIDYIDEHEFRSDVKRFYNDRNELIAVASRDNECLVSIVYNLGLCDGVEIIANCYLNHFGHHEDNQDTMLRRYSKDSINFLASIYDEGLWTEDLRDAYLRDDSPWVFEVWDADYIVDER